MERNFKLEKMEKELIDATFDESISKEDMLEMSQNMLKEARNETIRKEVLLNHIANAKGYPMNMYDVTSKKIDMGTWGDSELERVQFTYSKIDCPNEKINIFEQNWFSGYGTLVDGKYIGLLEG